MFDTNSVLYALPPSICSLGLSGAAAACEQCQSAAAASDSGKDAQLATASASFALWLAARLSSFFFLRSSRVLCTTRSGGGVVSNWQRNARVSHATAATRKQASKQASGVLTSPRNCETPVRGMTLRRVMAGLNGSGGPGLNRTASAADNTTRPPHARSG